jgi:broad specificity phosphatase PhoE
MPRLLLIRHGSHDLLGRELVGRRSGVHLSARGRAEAEALARRLSGLPIAALHCSPRERAVETAEPICAALRLSRQIEPALDEMDFGDWTGRTLDSLRSDPLWQRFNRDRALTRIPGGETMPEVAARMVRFMDGLTAKHGDGGETAIALVGHGDPIRAAIAQAIGLPLEFMLRFDVAPASLTILRTGEHGVLLERLNDFSHCD